MKKILLFFTVFIFLAGLVWGQAEFYFTGQGAYGDWYDLNNWRDAASGGSVPIRLPGNGSTTDIVIINSTVWNINITGDLVLQEIKINNGGSLLLNNHNLTVTNLTYNYSGQFVFENANISVTGTLELNGILDLSTGVKGSSIDFANLKLGNSPAGIRGNNATMNGIPVQVSPDGDQVNIYFNSVTNNLGNIDAGDRNITINIPNGSNVEVGNISSGGNITVNTGDNSSVEIGDISSGGNVTIDVGTGGSVKVDNIDAGGTINTSGGGSVNVNSSASVYTWNGSKDTNWNDNDNWDTNGSPGNGDSSWKIYIHISSPSPANIPVFVPVSGALGLVCDTLVIQTGASLDMGAYNLTVEKLDNFGNLILYGSGTQTVNITSTVANETVTFDAAGGTHFAGLADFNHLVITNGNRTVVDEITVGGNFTLTSGSLNAASISVTGESNFLGNVTTTGGTQTYTGNVTYSGARTFTGSTVNLGPIPGGGGALTINGNGVMHGGSGIGVLTVTGDFTLTDDSLTAASVNITGTSSIAADITSSAAQTYAGNVTLGNNVNFTGGAGNTIQFNGSVNGITAARDLTITNANVVFNGTVGSSPSSLIGNVNISAGTAAINADILTTGNQSYTGAVTLGGNITFSSAAGNTIQFDSTVNGITTARNLTITNANVVFNDVVGSTPASSSLINNITLTAAGTVSFNANVFTSGDISLTAAGTVSFYANIITTGNISINAAGTVTQTGTITTGILTLSGAGSYELNSANNVSAVKTAGTNPASIEYTNDVSIATGELTLGPMHTTGLIKITSGNEIKIIDDITANQFIAVTPDIVTVDGIIIQVSGTGKEGTDAAIYIEANNFIVTSPGLPKTAIILAGSGGQLCLVLKNKWADPNNVVNGPEDYPPGKPGARWHQHFIDLSKDLVYGDGTLPPGFMSGGNFELVYNNSNIVPSFTLDADKSIYIYNAEITPQNNSGLTFVTSGSGSIHFLGTNEFAGITLQSGTGGIHLADTDITVTGGFTLTPGEGTTLTANSNLPSRTGSSIKAANITLYGITTTAGKNLTLTSTSGDIIVNGAVGTNTVPLGNLTVTTADNVTFTGAIFANNIAVTSADNVTFSGAIDANSIAVTSADTTINANITTTGAQTYTGDVTLGNNINFTGDTGSTVQFHGSVNGRTTARDLTVTDANVVFNGTIGSSPASFIKILEVTAGSAAINADITTTGNQTYNGTVTLGGTGDRTLTANTTVTLGKITGNGKSLTITGNGVLNGGDGIGDLQVSGNFSLSNDSLNAKTVNITTGTSSISKDIITTGDQTYTGAVTLGGDIELKTNAGSTVRFSNTLNGTGTARDLTITNADVVFNGTVGSAISLIKSINVTAGTAAINADITTTEDQTYTGEVTLGGTGTRTLKGTKVTLGKFTGPGSTLNLTISGEGELNGGSDINTLTVSGDAVINADITTGGNQTYGDVTLGGTGTITLTTGTAGYISASDVTGSSIIINAGVNISLANITGGTFELNAGFPDHTVFGNPGDVTLTDINVTNLTIWCQTITSSGVSNTITGNIELYTDNDTVTGAAFIGSCTIGGAQKNELRPHSFEFGPAPTNSKYTFLNSTDTNNWPLIGATGHAYIYITGAITALDDLTITTESGNIVFNGTYNANGHTLTLETTNGKIDQPTASSIITVDNLTITAGGSVTLAQNNEVKNLSVISPAGNVNFKNSINLEISGINAGSNAVNLTVNGDIDLSGNINASSVSIQAGSIDGTGTVTASSGDITFNSSVAGAKSVSLERFTASGNIIVSAAKDIVYYSSVPSATQPSGGTWSPTPLFVEANSAYNGNVILRTQGAGNNIYLVDVVDSSQKTLTADSRAGTGTNGFIEFYTTGTNAYKYSGAKSSHLDLLPGAGGVRIEKAVVDITGDFKINNTNNKLTLGGSGKSIIKAANIILNDITAATPAADIMELEAGGNITINGNVTAYQLIAKASGGTVSVKAITIDPSNTGNEADSAAIYIVADTFVVTSTTPSSIIPGGKPVGAQWGQLCLELRNNWEDLLFIIDGDEDDVENIGSVPGARWHQHLPPVIINGRIIYSFTEDSDGNGRLDRIRVQTNVALNGDFSGFVVIVDGYEININEGSVTKGFDLVSTLTGKTPFDDDSFYIYLKENPDTAGGNTPHWSVSENTSLANKTGTALVGDPAADKDIKPIDTIPPRIAYTLTIPGHPQTYVRMSEPVVDSSGQDISASFGGLSVQSMSQAEPAGLGYLFNLSDSLKIEDLAKNSGSLFLADGYLEMDDVVDMELEPDWSAIDPTAPPKYPLNWGYTGYAKVKDAVNAQEASGNIPASSVFTPPNKLLTVDMINNLAQGVPVVPAPGSPNTVIRRATDVLVSRAPDKTDSENYFAWPVWARFKKSLNVPYAAGNDVFWGQQSTDTGIIWQFDGTNYLETSFIESNEGLELQARMNDSLSGDPVLFWTTSNIPAEYRNPHEASEARKTGGLWLPNVLNPLLYNYVPMSDGINSKPADSSSSKLYNYEIAASDIADSAKFEFIFRLSNISDLFIVRLDIPRGGAIPAKWYTLLRPFVFEIHNMRRQRGGVTIMNNVINSNNRETAFIRYHLTRPGRVTVQIYTLDGTLVKSLRRNDQREAGEWTDAWDGTNNGGRAVARGMYFVRVVGPDIDEIRKIMVIK